MSAKRATRIRCGRKRTWPPELADRGIRETLAAHALFGQLGIDAEHLYVLYVEPQSRIYTSYRPGTGKEYNVFVPWDGTEDAFHAAWKAAGLIWNGLPQAERERLYQESEFRDLAVPLIADMTTKGFLPLQKPPVH